MKTIRFGIVEIACLFNLAALALVNILPYVVKMVGMPSMEFVLVMMTWLLSLPVALIAAIYGITSTNGVVANRPKIVRLVLCYGTLLANTVVCAWLALVILT